MFQLFSKKLNISECLKRYFVRTHADCLLAPRTIKKYEEVGKRLLDLMGDLNVKKINDEYITQLKQKLNEINSSPSRKNHFLIVVRNLLQYLEQVEHIKVYNPEKITKFKVPKKEVEYLDKGELMRLVNYPSDENITGLRMRAYLETSISTGCRIAEVAELKIADIDFENGVAHIRTKGDKPHTILFNRSSLIAIKKYLSMRQDNHPNLFVSATPIPNPWKPNDIERSLRLIGKKLGFKKNIRPHLLRKSAATLMYKEGVSIGVIQNFLNHSSSRTTLTYYLGDANFDEVKKNHDRVMNFTEKGGEEK